MAWLKVRPASASGTARRRAAPVVGAALILMASAADASAFPVHVSPASAAPGSSVVVRFTAAPKCTVVIGGVGRHTVPARHRPTPRRLAFHISVSASSGARHVKVTCGRSGGHATLQIVGGYVAAPSDQSDDPGIDQSGSLGGGNFDNGALAEYALGQVGRQVGPCRQAVNDWASAVSGGSVRLGGSYLSDFGRNGGREVDANEAAEGDVIQLIAPGRPNDYVYGMHTAVIVGRTGNPATFDVVDANYDGRGIVEHHLWNPFVIAAKYHLEVTIWRLGTVGGVHPPLPEQTPQPSANPTTFTHKVMGTCLDGACGLRQRSGPGYSGYPQMGIIYDGQVVQVVCQTAGELVGPSPATGNVSNIWDRLTDDTYVSDLYLDTPAVNAFSPPIPRC